MWKRAVLIVLCFLFVCNTIAYAAEPRAVAIPTLDFLGRTAICGCNVSDSGKTLQVTMELREGSTLVGSWSETGSGIVVMSQPCTVKSGHTYTLSVRLMINGVSYGPYSVTKTCP